MSQKDIEKHIQSGPWRRLEGIALKMVAHSESLAKSSMQPRLGGGTRLMLALAHRVSDDIDFFIESPQWIGYLTPRLQDTFDDIITSYSEESGSLKLRMPEGEIDFICSLNLTGTPAEASKLTPFSLESIQEGQAGAHALLEPSSYASRGRKSKEGEAWFEYGAKAART